MSNAKVPAPPMAAKRPAQCQAHGAVWRDDYAWLRAANWREVLRDPARLPADIRALLDAENAYAEDILAPTRALQRELTREMRARLQEDDSEVPQPDGPYLYYSRFRHGGQHRLFCRRKRDGGREAILLDGDALAKDKPYFQLNAARQSPDHSRVAWSADNKGSEIFTLRVLDAASGDALPDAIENATGQIVWTRDSDGFLYVALDAEHRPAQVFLHRLGEPQSKDLCIFREKDPGWFISIAATRLGRSAFIAVHGHDASEAHVVDLDKPQAAPVLLAPRRAGFRYEAMDHGDCFFIKSNDGGAQDFKIIRARREALGLEHWREFLPHQPGRLIENVALFKDFLVALVREDNVPSFLVCPLAGGAPHRIAFEAQTYFLKFETMFEFDTPFFRFSFSSMVSPQEIYDYDMAAHSRHLRKTQMAPRDFDPQNYITRQIHAPSPDGESVPISLLYRRSTMLDGGAPLLIYGYGAYGQVLDANFSTNRFSLVDRGFVYAIAHVRGGTEKGWRWYEQGKLAAKPNSFADFIAATRHLIAQRFAAPDKIVCHGGSAGGLLVAAALNLAPELFAGAIADVPFVDVLNTMLDASLPLTPPEWLEWGDPLRDAAAFATIRSYSPYDNVRAQRYPAILALTGLADPRVTYWEPAKWVAKLRAEMTGGGPVLLRTNMDAGHGGAPGRFDRLEDVARLFAFAIACVQGRIGSG